MSIESSDRSPEERWHERLLEGSLRSEKRRLAPLWLVVSRAACRADPLVERLVTGGTLQTAGIQTELEHFHPERVRYVPSGWTHLRRVLRRSEISHTDVLLDVGCGKGRIVYQAARRYPFARVIGVDISSRLVEIAGANIKRTRHRLRCKEVQLVTADVRFFEIPDDVTIAYYYWAFVGETFRATVDNILASIDRRPREFRLIVSPIVPEYLAETGRFRPGRRVPIVHGVTRHASVSTWIADLAGPRRAGHGGL